MMFESLSNHNINYYLKSYNKYKTSHRWTYEIQISYSYIVKMSNKIAKDHRGGGQKTTIKIHYEAKSVNSSTKRFLHKNAIYIEKAKYLYKGW